MSLFVIKSIAIFTMLLDHIGVFFYPQNIYLRLIGRLSFPLFAWAIANGSIYTKNINKYFIRIFIFAVVSQIPYQLVFNEFGVTEPGLNILFTLSAGLLGIILFKKIKIFPFRLLIALILSILVTLIKSDYGIFGLLSIFVFYLFNNSKVKMGFLYSLLLVVFYLIPVFFNSLLGNIFTVSYLNILQIFSVLSLMFINLYDGKIGVKMKYFFYLFYPLHLTVIYLIKLLLP